MKYTITQSNYNSLTEVEKNKYDWNIIADKYTSVSSGFIIDKEGFIIR